LTTESPQRGSTGDRIEGPRSGNGSLGHEAGQYIERVTSTLSTDRPSRPAQARLPSLCAVCRGWGLQRICADCVERHAAPTARCSRCALEVAAGVVVCGACLRQPPPWRAARAAVGYGFPWDRLIAAFKFHDALDLAPAFAALIARTGHDRHGSAPPLLLPVPLSAERLRERGYNQAWELARRLAPLLGGIADAALLLRVRDTPHQLALPPERRAANVKGAFAVEPRRLAELRGRDVIVVDDVMTTGATTAEIAHVLLAAGAASVEIEVVARTPKPDDLATH